MRNLPLAIIRTLRWQLEVTFEEAPAHLGGHRAPVPTAARSGRSARRVGIVGRVLSGDIVCASVTSGTAAAREVSRLVRQANTHLCRYTAVHHVVLT